jgi:hypothetical protein
LSGEVLKVDRPVVSILVAIGQAIERRLAVPAELMDLEGTVKLCC